MFSFPLLRSSVDYKEIAFSTSGGNSGFQLGVGGGEAQDSHFPPRYGLGWAFGTLNVCQLSNESPSSPPRALIGGHEPPMSPYDFRHFPQPVQGQASHSFLCSWKIQVLPQPY